MTAEEFGQRIRRIRDFRGITQGELAAVVGGSSRQKGWRIENPTPGQGLPSSEVIEKLATFLRVPTEALTDDSVQLDLVFRPKAADESSRGTHLGKEHLLVPDEVYLDCAAAIKVSLRYDKELAQAFRDDLPSVIQDWLNRRVAASGQ